MISSGSPRLLRETKRRRPDLRVDATKYAGKAKLSLRTLPSAKFAMHFGSGYRPLAGLALAQDDAAPHPRYGRADVTGHRTRGVFERYNITDQSDTVEAGKLAEKFLSRAHAPESSQKPSQIRRRPT